MLRKLNVLRSKPLRRRERAFVSGINEEQQLSFKNTILFKGVAPLTHFRDTLEDAK